MIGQTYKDKKQEAFVESVVFLHKDGSFFADAVDDVLRGYESERRSKNWEAVSAAKVEHLSDGRELYYVKIGMVGIRKGFFYNPYHGFAREGELTFFDRASGRRYFEYQRVPKESFELYKEGLVTHNPLHIRNAERIALHG